MKDQTAAERIAENMFNRMAAIQAYFAADDDDERDRLQEEIDPLAIDREILIHVQLSTGGPGDGFKLRYNTDGELLGGVYYFADWYDYAERSLDRDEAEQVADAYGIYVEPEGR